MGYAKLNFATTVTTAQAMYDVVRVLNGTITATANLSYASTTNSEIVNTLAENWTVVYGDVLDSTTAYVVSSPCTTVGKTHFVKLQMGNATSWDASAAFSTAGAGIGLNTISAATSATSVTNPAFYSTSTGATGMGRYLVKVDASNTNIYIHWSSHHILFYGLSSAGATTMFIGSFEYPENSLTQFTNTAPVLQYNYTYAQTTTFITTTAVTTGTTSAILFQGINIHEPLASTTSGVYNLGVAGYGTVIHSDFDPIVTLDSLGNNVYPLVPYYWTLPSRGIPNLNLSQLTGVYRMAKSAGAAEAVFTVGGASYVWLPLSTTITGGTQQAGIGILKS